MDDIVNRLRAEGYLKTPAIIEAFRATQRKDFLPPAEQEHAESNIPLPIGYGQTNSQPLTVAFMLELLQPKPGERVLDVGAGSGWTAALFSQLVTERGSVRAVERIPQLCRFAQENCKKYSFPQLKILCADGTKPDPKIPVYDVIHIAAATPKIPHVFREQLAVGGRLLVPVGEGTQSIVLITRTSDRRFLEQRFPGFSFVPLLEGPLS